jgi:hypothetical protein
VYTGEKRGEGGATKIEVTNGRGLSYEFTVHQPVEGRPFNGFSLGESPIYPLSDIPYIVEALMGIYVAALDQAALRAVDKATEDAGEIS